MKPSDIVRYRLHNQLLDGSAMRTPAEVVAWMGALQAQDYRGALWSVGIRLPGSTQDDISAAVRQRQIIRSWPMRGTLHFVAAADIRWMVELLGPRAIASAAARAKNLELTEAVFKKSRQIIIKHLSGGRQQTRQALCQALDHNGIATAGQRGIHILRHLSQEGLLCFGPPEGKQPTFALLEEWVPKTTKLTRDESLARLAEAYFRSHGPAKQPDFMGWAFITAGDAKRAIELAGDAVVTEKIDGTEYFLSPNQTLPLRNQLSAWLLSGFDEFILGYKDRSAVLPAAHAGRIVPGNNGMFLASILLSGQVAGLWKQKLLTKGMTISLESFETLNISQRQAIEMAAQHYSKFMGVAVKVADR